jgi:bifunctional DNase/RNase
VDTAGDGPAGADRAEDAVEPTPVEEAAPSLEPAFEPAVEPAFQPAIEPPPATDATDFRMALVSSVTVDLPNQHPAICLREMEMPGRQLTFYAGLQDAVALSHAMRRVPTPRPLTHELMSEVLQRFDIDLVAVRIVGRVGSMLFAELDLRGRGGRSVHSCRPTDALTLALQQPVQVPILIDVRLLESGDDVPPVGSGL